MSDGQSDRHGTADYYVDCYGSFNYDSVTTRAAGATFHFIFNHSQKTGKQFTWGLFLNEAALSRGCYRYPRNRRLCVLLESPIRGIFQKPEVLEDKYDHIFTYHRGLLEQGDPYVPLYYGVSWVRHTGDFQDKPKLLSFVGSVQHDKSVPGYGFRTEIANWLRRERRADCFGKGIRAIDRKVDGLQDYCFSVAMENYQQDYYFTEKLIDCFLADCVPIYWGCSGISEIFDERGMIRFQTQSELAEIVRGLSFEKYHAMLPFVRKNKDLVIRNRWLDYEGLYSSLVEKILERSPVRKPAPWYSQTRPMAAARLVLGGRFSVSDKC